MVFFHVIIDYLYIFYEISTKFLHLFFNWDFIFSLLSYKSFSRLHTNSMSDICVACIFSQSRAHIFYFINSVFERKFFFFNFDEVHICRVEMFEDQVINGVLGQVYLTGA